MKIPVVIGKNSSGEDKFIDLDQIHVLFVSYLHGKQLYEIIQQVTDYENSTYFISQNCSRELQLNKDKCSLYIKDEPTLGNLYSRKEIFKQILKEIKRKRSSAAKKKTFPPQICFLIVDNIWDIITSKQKQLALDLMLIIIYGASIGYRIIIGSTLSYRNLLEQVIAMHPVLIKELENQFKSPIPKRIDEICDELIFTAEEFVYHKRVNSISLEKYYQL